MKAGNITFGNTGQITTKGTKIVTINRFIEIAGSGVELPIKIEADFEDIPDGLHHIYLQALESSYNI